jgi:hypothetical protein
LVREKTFHFVEKIFTVTEDAFGMILFAPLSSKFQGGVIQGI